MSGNGRVPSRIAVVGGVYRERCMWPGWKEVFGSAGRAASAISCMGGQVDLYTYVDTLAQEVLESRAALEDFHVIPTQVSQSIAFEYHHSLETPRIYGLGKQEPPLSVTADRIVRFGLLEGDAIVKGGQVVYDPQSASSPELFCTNGSTADNLALILNRREAESMTGLPGRSPENLAEHLIQHSEAQVVVIKLGAEGSLVHDGAAGHRVPAYQTKRVWKIGSGDNFVAHFAFHWMNEGKSPVESADLASQGTAYYCQTRGFATPDLLNAFKPKPVVVSKAYLAGYRPLVYLAGPFFTLAQLWLVEQALADLKAMGLRVFSPYHEVGHGSADDVVQLDLEGIDKADLVFAIGDGLDSGTIYEVGYTCAKAKPVIFYCENETDENKKMMGGSGCTLCDDYATAIYQTLWTACAL